MSTPIILFNSAFAEGALTASSTAVGFDVRNINDFRTYTFFRAAAAGTNFITVDCGAPRTVDCLAVIGHNLRTANATVSVESSVDNVTWTTRIAGFIPSSNRAFLRMFPAIGERFWRIRIVTAHIAPFLAVAMLGHSLVFPFPPDSPFVPYRESVEAESSIGKTGHILGSVVRFKPIEIFARFSNIRRSWLVDSLFDFFWNSHASRLRPFFWAWNITNFPDMVFYMTIDREFSLEMPVSILSFVDSIELRMRGVMEI